MFVIGDAYALSSLGGLEVKVTGFVGLPVVVLGLVMSALPLAAHHSFAAEFDGSKQITLTGVVTKVDWVNPHAYIYVDVKGSDGTVVNWAIETGAPKCYTGRAGGRPT